MRTKTANALLAAVFMSAPILSEAASGSAGLSIGTGGLGIDYAYPVASFLDVRAGYDFGSISKNHEEDGIDYRAKLKFSSARLLADLKPFGGGFRISAGLYTGTPEVDLESRGGQDDYDIGDRTYTGDLMLDGKVDIGGAAPYLGIGWGGTTSGSGFGVSFDIGVLFASSPNASLDATGTACDATATPGCDPNGPDGFNVNDLDDPRAVQFQANKDAEIAKLEDDAKDYDLWPIIRLGLHYRF